MNWSSTETLLVGQHRRAASSGWSHVPEGVSGDGGTGSAEEPHAVRGWDAGWER